MVLCSECFYDEGLKLSAFQMGVENDNLCENCGSTHIVYEGGCKICHDCFTSKCG